MSTFGLFNRPVFKDFEKLFVGFDEQLGRMLKAHAELIKQATSYPPVNVRKVDDNHYAIELAVAGFAQSDLDILMEGDKLIIKGNVKAEPAPDKQDGFLFRGIATRAFTRTFVLNDKVVVQNAELVNGLLKIGLERLAPPEPKTKKVPVTVPKSE